MKFKGASMAARVGTRRFIWNALISFAAVCFPVIQSYTILSFLCHSFHLQWQTDIGILRRSIVVFSRQVISGIGKQYKNHYLRSFYTPRA